MRTRILFGVEREPVHVFDFALMLNPGDLVIDEFDEYVVVRNEFNIPLCENTIIVIKNTHVDNI